MTAADELRVIHAEQRTARGNEVGVVDHFHAIRLAVDEVAGPQLIQHLVTGVVHQVVGNDGGQSPSPPGMDELPQTQQPPFVNQGVQARCLLAGSGKVQFPANIFLDFLDRVPHLGHHRVVPQHIGVDRVEGAAGDKEEDHRHVAANVLQMGIEASQSLNGEIEALVVVLVAPGCEEVNGVLEVEPIAGKEMSHHEFVNAFLVDAVQVLEHVDGSIALDVETIGKNDVGFSSQQMPALNAGDLAHGGKHRGALGSQPLDVDLRFDAIPPRCLPPVDLT